MKYDKCFSYRVVVQSHIRIGSTPPTPCQGDTQTQITLELSLSLSLNNYISASQSRTPAACTMWLVVGGGFSTLMHIKFESRTFIQKYIYVLQANMKVHSQGCMEVVTLHMRDNITTLVGFIVATLFIQVTPPNTTLHCTALKFNKFFYLLLREGFI